MTTFTETSQTEPPVPDNFLDGEARDAESKTKLKATYLNKLDYEQQARQLKFRDARTTHPALRTVAKDLLPMLMTPSDTNVIALTGATGSGKSTFTKVMLQHLVNDFDQLMDEDASTIPLVYVEARRDGNARNGFGRLYRKLIAQLWEPGMTMKVPFKIQDGRVVMRSRAHLVVDELREILEDCLKHRKTRVVVIDEAAQLTRFGRPEDVMDTIKSLANTTNTKWLLVGAFDLYDILETSDQIARRTVLFNLERYKKETKGHSAAFKKIVRNLLNEWPCAERPHLEVISDELLDVCLGCVGLLKTLMLDAANLQLRNTGEKWDYDFLRKAQKAVGLRRVIEKEIERGERRVQDAIYGSSLWDEKKFDQMIQRMKYEAESNANAL